MRLRRDEVRRRRRLRSIGFGVARVVARRSRADAASRDGSRRPDSPFRAALAESRPVALASRGSAGAVDRRRGGGVLPASRRSGALRVGLAPDVPAPALTVGCSGGTAPGRYCTTPSSARARRSSKSSRLDIDSTCIFRFLTWMPSRVVSSTRLWISSYCSSSRRDACCALSSAWMCSASIERIAG